ARLRDSRRSNVRRHDGACEGTGIIGSIFYARGASPRRAASDSLLAPMCYNECGTTRVERTRVMTTAYRNLPAVETLTQMLEQRLDGDELPRSLLADAARTEIEAARRGITEGAGAPPLAALVAGAQRRARELARPSLRPVVNATGVIIQTNLGRAPLSLAALRAMAEVGAGYSNLEYDLEAGERGSRATHLASLLCQLTGAEAAVAGNNKAAAIVLGLSALAAAREVIITRGH